MNPSVRGALPTVRVPRRNLVGFGTRRYGKFIFILIHLAVLSVLFVPFTWTAALLCVGFYLLRVFAITIGYHRYFAHRSFKTSRLFQCGLAVLGCCAVQKGPLWWAGNHRRHHRHSDDDNDPHSPVRHGLWWSHVGWVLSTRNDRVDPDDIRDFARFWELRFLDRFHWLPPLGLAVLSYFIGGWSGVVWGFIVSTVLVYHGTFLVNSVCHVLGSKRFATGDESRNNWWVALLTMGEGWHNNHHHYMSSAKIGLRWWEIDGGYYVLRLLAIPRLVWGLRYVPKAKLAG